MSDTFCNAVGGKRSGLIVASALAAIAGVLAPAPVTSAALTYDANTSAGGLQDGAGAGWNTTPGNLNWFDDGTSTYVAWPNTNTTVATFGAGSGAAGTVNVGAVTANGITFNAAGSGNYTLGSTGTITLDGLTPTITVAGGVTSTISAFLAGDDGLTKTGAGTLILGNTANAGFSGSVRIHQGTLTMGSNTTNALNGAAITLGDSSGSAGATFQVNRNQNCNSAITVQANAGAGTLRIAGGPSLGFNQAPTITGVITLNNNLTVGNGVGGATGGVRLSSISGDSTRTITIDGAAAGTLAVFATSNTATLSSAFVVNSGTLQLNASGVTGTGSVTVNGGANASIQGTNNNAAQGNVTVTNASQVAPGNNGNLLFGGTSTLGLGTGAGSTLSLNNAILNFDLAATPLLTSDRIATNALSLGTIAFHFNAITPGSIQLDMPYTLINAADAAPAITVPGAITTTFTAASNFGADIQAIYSVNGTNDLVVTFSNVPEPTGLAMIGLGLTTLLRRRR